MAQEINVLVVEAGKVPRPAKVLNTLDAFSEIVGGPIEIGAYLPQRVLLIFNSEGERLGLPPNRVPSRTEDYIAGTFLLCGFEDSSFTSLTQEQQMEFQKYFSASAVELTMTARKLWESMCGGKAQVPADE